MIVFASLDEVDRRQLAVALDLLALRFRTNGFPPPTATLLRIRGELAKANAATNVPRGSTATFRSSTVDRVSTDIAAARLGVTPRAVVARLQRGTLRGVQLADRRWLVDVDQLPPLDPATGSTGQAGAEVGGAGPGHPSTTKGNHE